ncbi:hypothetical protein FWF74_03825 [Candidatus Saccharibacteria bacterium]|nr:hypothetical protein [Candidatus Saccharibacteria bacterium]MCL1963012.1 hypothetical protein [Candidatus Saccharibacteria bacterium]
MAITVPISELRDYNKVTSLITPENPEVELTLHGRTKYVLTESKAYAREKARQELHDMLQESIDAVENGCKLYTLEESMAELGINV